MSIKALATKSVRGKAVLSISVTQSKFISPLSLELWAASLEHSRTQQRKQDRCSSSPQKHTCNAGTFRGLAQTQPHSTSHTPHSDCSLILREIPFRAILSWFLGASIALLTPLPTTSLGPAVGQQQIKGQSAHLQPGLPSNWRMRAAALAERLGKVQPCCFMSTFLPLCLSQGLRQKILFCSYQFKQEQWIPQARKNVTRCQQSQPGRWCMVYRLQLK